eukprot:3810863-Prymnesium_polylepis.1
MVHAWLLRKATCGHRQREAQELGTIFDAPTARHHLHHLMHAVMLVVVVVGCSFFSNHIVYVRIFDQRHCAVVQRLYLQTVKRPRDLRDLHSSAHRCLTDVAQIWVELVRVLARRCCCHELCDRRVARQRAPLTLKI